MKTSTSLKTTLAATAVALMLGACASPEPQSPNVPSYQSRGINRPNDAPQYATGAVVAPRDTNTGVVSSIDLIRGQTATGMSPGGTIIGAVVGGVLGNQVGAGRGKALATVAGAGAGALAGNAIGKSTRDAGPDTYRIGISYDAGGTQFIDVPDPGDLRAGDRVRVDGNQISRY